MAVVEKPVEHRADGRGTAQQLSPVFHRPVGGQQPSRVRRGA
jgi:hypothetical protein